MDKAKQETKGIFLDLDGTVVDSREAYLEAARTAYQEIGCETPDLRAALIIPKLLEQRLPLSNVSAADRSRFLKVYLERFYAITLEMTQPFPNMERTLLSLTQKGKLALITMRFVPKTAVIRELEHFGLAEYFYHVVTALDTPNPKPSPEAIIEAAKRLNIKLCNCMVVGDSISDVKAGKAAGAATVGVSSGLFSKEELSLEKPDLILNSLTDLPRFWFFE